MSVENLIKYSNSAIVTALSDQASYLKNAVEVKEDIRRMFENLDVIYDGEAAKMLSKIKTQIDRQLDDVFNNIDDATKHAGQQNELMQALDAKNAALFS